MKPKIFFIVIAENQETEEKVSKIIINERNSAGCVTSSQYKNMIGDDFTKTFVDIKEFFRIRKNSVALYFLLFPPDNLAPDNDFLNRKYDDIQHFSNDLTKYFSVWFVGDTDPHVPGELLPHCRSYLDWNSLEQSLRKYIRLQEQVEEIPVSETISIESIPVSDKTSRSLDEPLDVEISSARHLTEEIPLMPSYFREKEPITKDYPQKLTKIIVRVKTKEEPAMEKWITIFAASEAKEYVNELQNCLNQEMIKMRLKYRINIWYYSNVWEIGYDTITALIEYSKERENQGGYAVCFFTPDDTATIRGAEYYISRDNVWLEYGLFAARFNPTRVFAVCPNNPVKKDDKELDWHCPTDFNIQKIPYTFDPQNMNLHIKILASDIAGRINRQTTNPSGIGQATREDKNGSGWGINPKS